MMVRKLGKDVDNYVRKKVKTRVLTQFATYR